MSSLRTKISIRSAGSLQAIGALVAHIRRETTPPNADPALAKVNELILDLIGELEFTAYWRTATQGAKRHGNASYAVMLVLQLPEGAASWSQEKNIEWGHRTVHWLQCYLRAKGILCLVSVHFDELRPHVHALFIPIFNGRVAQRTFFGKLDLKRFHSAYFDDVGKAMGLERGLPGSRAKNQDIRRFDAAVRNPLPEIEMPASAFPNCQYPLLTQRQRDEYRERCAEAAFSWYRHRLQAFAAKAANHELILEQKEGAEATAKAKIAENEQLREKLALATTEREAIAQEHTSTLHALETARAQLAVEEGRLTDSIPLDALLRALGFAEKNGAIAFPVAGRSVECVNGVVDHAQFPEIDAGTVSMVRAITGWEFPEAVAFISRHFGADAATGAVVCWLARWTKALPTPPIPFPPRDDKQWQAVREHCVSRGVNASALDAAHAAGLLYTSSAGGVIVVQRDAANCALGFAAFGFDGSAQEYRLSELAVARFGTEHRPHVTVLCGSLRTAVAMSHCDGVQTVLQTGANPPWDYLRHVQRHGSEVMLCADDNAAWRQQVQQDSREMLSTEWPLITTAEILATYPPRIGKSTPPKGGLHGYESSPAI
jgi:hypothetical protein